MKNSISLIFIQGLLLLIFYNSCTISKEKSKSDTGNDNCYFDSLLIKEVKNSDYSQIELLFEKGANPNYTTTDGECAMCLALQKLDTTFIQLAIENNVSFTQRVCKGRTPFKYLYHKMYSGNYNRSDFGKSLVLIKKLVVAKKIDELMKEQISADKGILIGTYKIKNSDDKVYLLFNYERSIVEELELCGNQNNAIIAVNTGMDSIIVKCKAYTENCPEIKSECPECPVETHMKGCYYTFMAHVFDREGNSLGKYEPEDKEWQF